MTPAHALRRTGRDAQAKGKHGDAEERAAHAHEMNAAQRADSLQLLFMDF
jgi:hypothetical protein